ncbi:MAG TPA: KGG domain-containing protein [Ktedonobacteraceae bacterium]
MILETSSKRPRGLAAMSPERRREIASKGGRTSQARGTAHQWTAEEASAAGKKGSARYALRKAEITPDLVGQ